VFCVDETRFMMTRYTSALARFTSLSLPRKRLYAEVLVRLFGAWIVVRCVPFNRWKRLLRPSPNVMQLGAISNAELRFLTDLQHVFRQIKWATRDRATCLMMVLVARWMLNRRRIPSTIYLGVRRDPEKTGLYAHAWMRSVIDIVGHENADGYTVVEKI